MQDIQGKDVSVGDRVIFTDKHYKKLNKGIVKSIAEKSIRVLECYSNWMPYSGDAKWDFKRCYEGSFIKIE